MTPQVKRRELERWKAYSKSGTLLQLNARDGAERNARAGRAPRPAQFVARRAHHQRPLPSMHQHARRGGRCGQGWRSVICEADDGPAMASYASLLGSLRRYAHFATALGLVPRLCPWCPSRLVPQRCPGWLPCWVPRCWSGGTQPDRVAESHC